ncbi:mechanosensitive ion channel [Alkalibacter rhizosphaerae]|uniref:Mechanosensitive ion channel n=1 Tax=Alkalibacter rhizosphaerae TaxID=2815577 RepID=A0A974XGJ2_9FIRM|nr:mechanosensitive ion channel domain-containing protein [Alkalibacter rhizosphaerae]QSX09371.1 mechanosensitive ion channel [Alkalibacter rhizosphaerae]
MDWNFIWEQVTAFSGKLPLALVVLVAGWILIKFLMRFLKKAFEAKNVDVSLRPFLLSLIKVTLLVMLGISIASMLGAQMTSFIAILGSAGLAVGLALQGSLSNFAGGVLILLLKPYKVGDYIDAAGYSGTVEEIQMFYTILITPDNKKIIVPNSNMSNSGTVNYSAKPTRRVDLVFGVGYDDDISKVKSLLQEIADKDPLVLDEPEPMIVLGQHDASSVNFYYRVWCNAADYWTIYFDTMEKVKLAFDEHDIGIPYPQMDVHLDGIPEFWSEKK